MEKPDSGDKREGHGGSDGGQVECGRCTEGAKEEDGWRRGETRSPVFRSEGWALGAYDSVRLALLLTVPGTLRSRASRCPSDATEADRAIGQWLSLSP